MRLRRRGRMRCTAALLSEADTFPNTVKSTAHNNNARTIELSIKSLPPNTFFQSTSFVNLPTHNHLIMEETVEPPRRRSVERTSSITSVSPQITSRRDSLFGTGVISETGDESDHDSSVPITMLSTAHLHAPSTPRRRFARRNGLCQFQLLQDAVHTAIDMNGLDLGEERYSSGPECEANNPHSPDFLPSSSGTSCPASPTRTRKVSLPLIHEAGAEAATEATGSGYSDAGYLAGGEESPSRKLSRTCYRPNPSTDAIYTEDSTL